MPNKYIGQEKEHKKQYYKWKLGYRNSETENKKIINIPWTTLG